MYWFPAQTEACVDFNGYGAQRRGRASRIFSSSAGSSVRWHGSSCFIVVSASLRFHGRFSNGELQRAGASRLESGARIYLRGPPHIAESSPRAGDLQRDRITFRPAIEKEDANESSTGVACLATLLQELRLIRDYASPFFRSDPISRFPSFGLCPKTQASAG